MKAVRQSVGAFSDGLFASDDGVQVGEGDKAFFAVDFGNFEFDRGARRQFGRDAGHADDQRQAVDADKVFFQDLRLRFNGVLLLQPDEAPIAFQVALEILIGGVGGFEVADFGKQAGIAVFKAGFGGGVDQADELFLVDIVGGAAQG